MTPQRIHPKPIKESNVRECDTGACFRADPQPDGSVVVYSTLNPDRTVRFTAEEWAVHVADLEAVGYRRAIADLRDTDAVWRWANETGTASRTIPATGWPHQIHDLADYLEAQTKLAEVRDGRS